MYIENEPRSIVNRINKNGNECQRFEPNAKIHLSFSSRPYSQVERICHGGEPPRGSTSLSVVFNLFQKRIFASAIASACR